MRQNARNPVLLQSEEMRVIENSELRMENFPTPDFVIGDSLTGLEAAGGGRHIVSLG
jgi:hypothetical protein